MTKQSSLPKGTSESSSVWAGIDVGGTSIKLGLVADDGTILAETQMDTEEPRGPADAMRRSAETLRSLAKQKGLPWESIVAVGLGTPGSQDIARGWLIEPPNHPHWHHFGIVECLSQELGKSVHFANDANAAAYGEFWLGLGKGRDSMVLLTLGTGVGGGIITDHHLIVGANSFGSECGHVIVDGTPGARDCVWGGGKGHLEAYCSASAVAAITEELLDGHPTSLLHAHRGKVTAKKIFEAAVEGDAFARERIAQTAYWLGIGIASIVHMVDPGLVVLGGAMDFGGDRSHVGAKFLEDTVLSFRQRSFDHVSSGTTIAFAKLGSDAGFLGAAGIARHQQRYPRRGKQDNMSL